MSKLRVFLLAVVLLLFGGGLAAYLTHRIYTGKGTSENPVVLPEHATDKITGKSWFSGKTINSELYNGTDWTLTDVDVAVSNKKKGQERRFRLAIWDKKVEWQKDARGPNSTKTRVTLIPYATGEFEGDIGDFLDGVETKEDWSWGIESARGFKQ